MAESPESSDLQSLRLQVERERKKLHALQEIGGLLGSTLDLNELLALVDRWRAGPKLRDVSRLRSMTSDNPVLLRRSGYRESGCMRRRPKAQHRSG